MRYPAARTRTTLDLDLTADAPESQFFLRADTELGPGHIARAMFVILRCVLTMTLIVFWLYTFPPTTHWVFFFYLPLALAFAFPLAARLSRDCISPVALWLMMAATTFVIVHWMEHVTPKNASSRSDENFLAYIFAFLFSAPFVSKIYIVRASVAFSGIAFFLLCCCVGLGWMLFTNDPTRLFQMLLILSYLFSLWGGVALLRSYAGWLACNPAVSAVSAIALMRIARRSFIASLAALPVRVLLLAACYFAAPLCAYYSLATWHSEFTEPVSVVKVEEPEVKKAGIINHERIWRTPEPRIDEVPRVLFARLSHFAVACAATWMLLSVALFVVARRHAMPSIGLLKAFVIWQTDKHDTPTAPGVYSVSDLDSHRLPIRRCLTTAFFLPAAFLLLLASFAPGASSEVAIKSLIQTLTEDALPQTSYLAALAAVAGWLLAGSASLLLFMSMMFSPLFRYIESVAGGRNPVRKGGKQ